MLKNAVVTDVKTNDSVADKQELYRQVAIGLEEDEIGVFDAGFKLVEAAEAGIEQCVIRLALNCTLTVRSFFMLVKTNQWRDDHR